MAPGLILLHGFTHTGASWDPVRAQLGERYSALAPDVRGHGTAAERRPVTLEAQIEDIAVLAPARFTLVGYSMGGRIALHVALALPERVQRLVLLGASPGIADPLQRARRRASDERLAEQIERSSIEEFADTWAANPVLADQPAGVQRLVREDRLRNSPAGLAAALRGLGAGALPSVWERLSELRMPIALAAGERDVKFSQIAEQMATRIGSAQVAIVPGAGHAVHLEQPAAVAVIIADGP